MLDNLGTIVARWSSHIYIATISQHGLINDRVFVHELELSWIELLTSGNDLDFFVVVGGASIRGDHCFLEISVVEVGTSCHTALRRA